MTTCIWADNQWLSSVTIFLKILTLDIQINMTWLYMSCAAKKVAVLLIFKKENICKQGWQHP